MSNKPAATKAVSKADFRCMHRLRVRWAEVDMQKIVFNGHYLMYVDTAVADYWRALAFPYEAGMQNLGGDLYVKSASLEYMASAHYDDVLDIGVRCTRVGNSSLQFEAGVFLAETLLVRADLIYVFANPASQKSQPVPGVLRQLLDDYEAGAPIVDLHLGDWSKLRSLASQLRTAVFVQEQAIPADMEWDEADHAALHAVISNRLGQAVATGRLLEHAPGIARVGRMAVARALRGGGLGAHVLAALTDAARQRGDREIILHAQMSAQGFYDKAGFKNRGERFVEAGIAHIEMFKIL